MIKVFKLFIAFSFNFKHLNTEIYEIVELKIKLMAKKTIKSVELQEVEQLI